MKKVLFATTALVASAGIASAQGIALSGQTEMGIVGGGAFGDNIQFWTDVEVTFTFSGETDNGLTFGGKVDLDEPVAAVGTDDGGASVFISGSFGTLTMGDTDGAFDWALTEVAVGAGTIDDTHTLHGGYNGNGLFEGTVPYDNQVARYDYSFGDFAFAASVVLDDAGVRDPQYAVGAKYSGTLGALDLGVGIGYEAMDAGGGNTATAVGGSLSLGFSGFQLVGNFTSFDNYGFNSHYGIGASYTIDAITLSGNYGAFDGGGDPSGFAVAANYALGGGAVAMAGYSSTDGGTDRFSLGLQMNF